MAIKTYLHMSITELINLKVLTQLSDNFTQKVQKSKFLIKGSL